MPRPVWVGIACWCLSLSAALAAEVKPVEQTLAFEMFGWESRMRTDLPADADAVLRRALDAGTKAALAGNPHPRTRDEALAALEHIQVAFERQRFLQPAKKDWPNTLGEALTPVARGDDRASTAMALPENTSSKDGIGSRVGHVDEYDKDKQKPVYLVDCDIGAMLFISVAQRVGWDLRLVEGHRHNYLHWHLADGTVLNWDWTHRESLDNARYLPDERFGDWLRASRSGRSLTLDFARSYFLTLISFPPRNGEKITDRNKRAVLEEAVAIDPANDWPHNALAWTYVTDPALDPAHAKAALGYALAAMSADPGNADVADTLACAYAAIREYDLASAFESYALAHPDQGEPGEERCKARDERLAKAFGDRLKAFGRKETCAISVARFESAEPPARCG